MYLKLYDIESSIDCVLFIKLMMPVFLAWNLSWDEKIWVWTDIEAYELIDMQQLLHDFNFLGTNDLWRWVGYCGWCYWTLQTLCGLIGCHIRLIVSLGGYVIMGFD